MEEQIVAVLQISGRTVFGLFPYVLAGLVLGEILRLVPWKGWISKGSTKFRLVSIVVCAVLGMISPLCTYGTVPVVITFFQAGFPLPPLVTFLAVSSLMNPQLFLMTWFWIGPEMAAIRAGAVLVLGILLGLFLLRLPQKWILNPGIFSKHPDPSESRGGSPKRLEPKKFLLSVWNSLQFIGFYMVIGILLGSLVEVYVPGKYLTALFKPGQTSSVLMAALLGVPLYPCGGGTIPLVRSMMLKGMSKGSALTFFIVGPATRVTPLMALATVLRPLFIVLYIFSLIGYSIIAGVLYH
ncbi:MAG: permease [Gemmatimonadota bacterium]|nr:MAG: permease [Gemmatimonadota bacterium]